MPIEMTVQEVLNAAWAKVGQLSFQIDLLTQQLTVLDAENKSLKDKLEKNGTPKVKNPEQAK